jgi:putative flippase GtrA
MKLFGPDMRAGVIDELVYIFRFGIVGLAATAVHALAGFGVASAGSPVLLANFGGFAAGWTISFTGHYAFTFRSEAHIGAAMGRFLLVSLVLLVLSQMCVAGASLFPFIDRRLLPLVGAVAVPPASYLLYRFFAFAG